MRQETPAWECVLDAKAEVGEAPTWDPGERALYWIDIYGPTLNRTEPESGATQSWRLPDLIGSFALRGDGRRAVVALKPGIFELDLGSGSVARLHEAPYDRENYRFNDGRCDRVGRFWVGSARLPGSSEPDGRAAFWRLDRRGLSREITGTTIANGIAWSPDGRVMYLADRPNWQILAFDYEPAAGTVSNRRVFARIPEGQVPDGAAVDAEGGYWIALFRAGRIVRFAPDGRLDRDLKAPSLLPTMVAFGGPELSTMYVTTSRRHMDEDGRAREPLAGGIFRCEVGARGLPEPRYAG